MFSDKFKFNNFRFLYFVITIFLCFLIYFGLDFFFNSKKGQDLFYADFEEIDFEKIDFEKKFFKTSDANVDPNSLNFFYFLKTNFYVICTSIWYFFCRILQCFWLTRQLTHYLNYFLDVEFFFFQKDLIGGSFYWDVRYLNKYNLPYNFNHQLILNRVQNVNRVHEIQTSLNNISWKVALYTGAIFCSLKLLNVISNNLNLITV